MSLEQLGVKVDAKLLKTLRREAIALQLGPKDLVGFALRELLSLKRDELRARTAHLPRKVLGRKVTL